MKTPIKLEDFQKGNISIECSSQKQVDKIAEWAGVTCDEWDENCEYVQYAHGFLLTWPKPEEYNYKFADVELID